MTVDWINFSALLACAFATLVCFICSQSGKLARLLRAAFGGLSVSLGLLSAGYFLLFIRLASESLVPYTMRPAAIFVFLGIGVVGIVILHLAGRNQQ